MNGWSHDERPGLQLDIAKQLFHCYIYTAVLPLQADNAEQLVPCQEALAEVLVENLTRRSGNQGVALLSDKLLKASPILSVMPCSSLMMSCVWQVIQGCLGVSLVHFALSCLAAKYVHQCWGCISAELSHLQVCWPLTQ